MKKAFLFVLLATLSLSNFAQIKAGAGICFATDISTLGFSIAGSYAITDDLEAAPSLTMFLEKDYLHWKVLDLDARYYVYEISDFNIYGIGGLSINFWKIKIPELIYPGYTAPAFTDRGSKLGLNIGVGAKYDISDAISLFPEIRFTIANGNFLRIGATAQYQF